MPHKFFLVTVALLSLSIVTNIVADEWVTSNDASPEQWVTLGERTVDFQLDHDEIVVSHPDLFSAIKIEVEEGNLEIFNLNIYFTNGEKFTSDIRSEFKDNSRSRIFDLPGTARAINKIEFVYKSIGLLEKATIRIIGKRSDESKEKREVRWEKLGSRYVLFRNEKDMITVTAGELYDAIRFDVAGANLILYKIRVNLGDDEVFSPGVECEFKQGLKQGFRSNPIDLPGGNRVIHSVEFYYRCDEPKVGSATINLFGRHQFKRENDYKNSYLIDAKNKDWKLLATQYIGWKLNHDTIELSEKGTFREIRLETEDSDLELYDMIVSFEDGENFSPANVYKFDEKTKMCDIDLPGQQRTIKKIDFYYRSKVTGREGRSMLKVYGKN